MNQRTGSGSAKWGEVTVNRVIREASLVVGI